MLLVDGGDCFFSTPGLKAPERAEATRDINKGNTILHAYNLLGYQALGIGPADLQYGIEKLQEFEKAARFPFISTNLVRADTKEPIFKRSVVLTVGGVRFGLFCVMLDKLNPTYRARAFPEAALLEPMAEARKVVAELKDRCDVVVALSQLNTEDSSALLDANPEIDVLIDPQARNGIKAIWINPGEYVVEHAGRPLLRIDGQGSRVGVLDMSFEEGKPKFTSYQSRDVALEPHYMDHPGMTDLVQKTQRGAPPAIDAGAATTKVLLSDLLLGQEACASCHEEQHTFWKATPHANTFLGLEKTGDHLNAECIGCHTLGYGISFTEPAAVGTFKEVQCENCHGVRPGHAEDPRRVPFGKVKEDSCWGCHNPQIIQKNFDYESANKRAACPKITR